MDRVAVLRVERECSFYETSYRKKTAECACPAWQQQQGSSTPLVLAFDNQPVLFNGGGSGSGSDNPHASFNLTRDGQSHGGDWPSASTPWLAVIDV